MDSFASANEKVDMCWEAKNVVNIFGYIKRLRFEKNLSKCILPVKPLKPLEFRKRRCENLQWKSTGPTGDEKQERTN
jgi:hypothetical protein